MSLQPVKVDIQRNQASDDGAGGVTDSWVTIQTGLRARLHIHSRRSEFRQEDVGTSASGPGVLTQKTPYFAFNKPYPDVQVNDRIAVVGGETYTVLFVRPYAELNQQVDVEIVS